MQMLQIMLSATEDNDCLALPAEEWRALMAVGRHNGWDVQACGYLPCDPIRRRNADYRVPWSGGRTLGDGDRMSAAEAQSLADAIEAGAKELVEFLRGVSGDVRVSLLDFLGEDRRSRLAAQG